MADRLPGRAVLTDRQSLPHGMAIPALRNGNPCPTEWHSVKKGFTARKTASPGKSGSLRQKLYYHGIL